MNERWTDRIARGCFLAALVCLASFHFLVFESFGWGGEWDDFRGWEIWRVWWSGVGDFANLDWFGMQAVLWAAIHLMVLLVVASPFLVRWLAASRLLWWLTCGCSAVAMVGIVGYLSWNVWDELGLDYYRLGPGYGVLLTCPILHFIGVMFVRGAAPLARRERGC